MEAQLYARVQHYAAHYDYDSAVFIAEQLLAACRTRHQAQTGSGAQQQSDIAQLAASLLHSAAPSSAPSLASSPSSSFLHSVVLLLAQCYYDSGTAGVAKAYHLLLSTLPSFSAPLCASDAEHQHRYLLSLAAFDLQQLQEAERLLLPLLSLPDLGSAASSPSVYNLLATICLRTGRKDEAVRYHRLALRLDPFLFSSFSALANLGVELDTEQLFPFASSSGVAGRGRGVACEAGVQRSVCSLSSLRRASVRHAAADRGVSAVVPDAVVPCLGLLPSAQAAGVHHACASSSLLFSARSQHGGCRLRRSRLYAALLLPVLLQVSPEAISCRREGRRCRREARSRTAEADICR